MLFSLYNLHEKWVLFPENRLKKKKTSQGHMSNVGELSLALTANDYKSHDIISHLN